MLSSSSRSRRRVGAAALLLSTAFVAATMPSFAEDLEDQQDAVERSIDQANNQIEHSSARLMAATKKLEAAQDKLDVAEAKLAKTRVALAKARDLDLEMQNRLAVAEAELLQAQERLARGEAAVAEQNDLLRRLVVSRYTFGDPRLLSLTSVVRTQRPSDVLSQISAMETVSAKESSILERLEEIRDVLAIEEDAVEEAKDVVAQERQLAAENLQVKADLETQAQQDEASVQAFFDQREAARAAAAEIAADDQAELQRLQAERARIAALIAERASTGSGYVGPVTGNGFLDWPAPGTVTSPYGYRVHPIYGYRSLHDGIDIGVGCGVEVRASAAGTVLDSYYHDVWGNRMIIDHGVKYGVGVATISNHLSGFAVSPGERVERGQVIGYIGSTGWSTGCHLHYTVLENGNAVDPMKWL